MFIIVIKATARQFNITAALIHWGSSADQAALSSINFQFEARHIGQSKVTNQIEFNKFSKIKSGAEAPPHSGHRLSDIGQIFWLLQREEFFAGIYDWKVESFFLSGLWCTLVYGRYSSSLGRVCSALSALRIIYETFYNYLFRLLNAFIFVMIEIR